MFDMPTVRLALLGLFLSAVFSVLVTGLLGAIWHLAPPLQEGSKAEYCERPDADGNQKCYRWSN